MALVIRFSPTRLRVHLGRMRTPLGRIGPPLGRTCTALERSAGLFTILPVRAAAATELAPGDGVGALLWLPVLGAVLGAAAGLPDVAVRQWAPHAGPLGAVLSVAALAVLTRCLHLDGLADTTDGLASRAPAERALEIMRKSDIGPFGVVAIVFAVLAGVVALAGAPGGAWTPVPILAVAAATGRVAAVQAAMRGVPAARSSGFGALVGGGVPAGAVAAWTVAVLMIGTVTAQSADVPVIWLVAMQCCALGAGWLLRVHAVRRLGGTTGDVFGALIELVTAVALVGIVLW
jgi:adenosylcobinamide-GDP ribazoletransferase